MIHKPFEGREGEKGKGTIGKREKEREREREREEGERERRERRGGRRERRGGKGGEERGRDILCEKEGKGRVLSRNEMAKGGRNTITTPTHIIF